MSEFVEVKTQDEFDSLLEEWRDGVVVVFSALDWCIPCQRLHPHMEKLAELRPDLKFVSIDDPDPANHTLFQQFSVVGVPTVFFIGEEGNDDIYQVEPRDLNGQKIARRLDEFFGTGN